MKIFISADIEGVTGIAHWDETNKTKPDYADFSEQMTAEVKAACEGALEAGATEIYIKDAHDTGRNLKADKLPEQIKLIRGWSGHPFSMLQEVDNSFDAVLMTGYHSRAGANTNPLAHTMSSSTYSYLELNGKKLSEFAINAYTAGMFKVPVVFVCGDEGICEEARELIPKITTVGVNKGVGNSTISIHPKLAVEKIHEGVKKALSGKLADCIPKMPDKYDFRIMFKEQKNAYRASFFPGAELLEPHIIGFKCKKYLDFLKLLMFV